jgi:hypothetical protein
MFTTAGDWALTNSLKSGSAAAGASAGKSNSKNDKT